MKATMFLKYQGGDFIYRGSDTTYIIKRGTQVISSVLRNSSSFGVVGSDLLGEVSFEGVSQDIAPISNECGQSLRFGLIARPDYVMNKSIDVITSYPANARRVLGRCGIDIARLEYVPGKVEAEVAERGLIGFELIQSGNSILANDLLILEDNLEAINLVKIMRTERFNDER